MKRLIEKFLCPGCVAGCAPNCESYKEETLSGWYTCGNHHPGTLILGLGNIYLGMPKGFNRTGDLRREGKFVGVYVIPESLQTDDFFNDFNIPVWKTKEAGHTLIRGLRPRINQPFLMIWETQNNFEKIQCLEITDDLKAGMD